jgi:hypothetical protein
LVVDHEGLCAHLWPRQRLQGERVCANRDAEQARLDKRALATATGEEESHQSERNAKNVCPAWRQAGAAACANAQYRFSNEVLFECVVDRFAFELRFD